MAITPGTYLRKRRETSDQSIADAAGLIVSEPRLPLHEREEWLTLIESDQQPASASTIDMLLGAFDFDGSVFNRLIDLHYLGLDLPAPRLCRTCACSQWDPCIGADCGDACHWVAEDLCSECAGSPAIGACPVADNDVAGAASGAVA